jgi:hypothetical protein
LAIECDGDRYHPIEKLGEDMERQAILERLGWRFARIRGSEFFQDPECAMKPVFARLEALDIPPVGAESEPVQRSSVTTDLVDRVVRRAQELRGLWQQITPDEDSFQPEPQS